MAQLLSKIITYHSFPTTKYNVTLHVKAYPVLTNPFSTELNKVPNTMLSQYHQQ